MPSDSKPSISTDPVRRVVTGFDAQGRSAAIIDGAPPRAESFSPLTVSTLWSSDTIPIDNAGNADRGGPAFDGRRLAGPGYTLLRIEFAPGFGTEDPGMHFTNSIDNIIMMSGQLTLVLETGDVVLNPGDVLVIRGHIHGWRNDSGELASAIVVNLPAHQVSVGKSAF